MSVTQDDVKHVANLARLQINESELGEYQNNLSKILEHINELNKVDTEGVVPMFNTMRENEDFYLHPSKKRDDEAQNSLPVEDVLQNAPDKAYNQIKIKAVIDAE